MLKRFEFTWHVESPIGYSNNDGPATSVWCRMPRMRRAAKCLVVESVLAMCAGLSAPTASAAIPLGGGAGIIVDGSYCTLTTIGHDNTGELVGFTAASCGGAGARVVAEGAEDRSVLGTVATVDDDLDYAVIRFDSTKVTPIPDFVGFAIEGIGPDPSFGQPACTQGGATGFGCGQITVRNRRPGTMTALMAAWQSGDEGAPVTVEGRLVGMTRRGETEVGLPVPVVWTHIGFTLFNSIIDDVNTNGGLGVGFTPVGS